MVSPPASRSESAVDGPLKPSELHTLSLICDTLLPPGDDPWRQSTPQRAAQILGRLPNRDDLRQLRLLLAALELPPTCAVLGGGWGRFSSLDRARREAVMRGLAGHRLNLLRGGFHALKRLTGVAYYAADEGGANPLWPAMNYPGPIAPSPDVPRTIQPLSVEGDMRLDCDVLIVGSGAGGGMAAAELAEAGLDVIVMEKGGYFAERDFNQRETEMLRHLYLDGGLAASKDQGIVLLAGSCLGGGTVVNYTTSFRLPDDVRREWAAVSGFDLFTGSDFTRSLDAAWQRMHVNTDHNWPSRRDALMAWGLEKLDWHVDAMPRDVQGCTQDDVCGYCGFGCVRGAKCSTLKTSLQDAYALGARILVDCTADRVLVEKGRAGGIVAHTTRGHIVTVHARVVAAAAGAIQTPALLLRSGLGAPVGQGLRLHPAAGVFARFEEAVRPWTGSLQALYSSQLADLDGGYGVRFETVPIHPALMSLATPWDGGAGYDAAVRELAHTSLIGILLRDRDAGRITVSRDGLPEVRYAISRYDQRHVRRGIEAAARVLLAAGARSLFAAQLRPNRFDASCGEPLEEWLRRVDQTGYGPNRTPYVSFHQMGTCRMGSDWATSVVDDTGQCHTLPNLYVADGSLFPTASGVNPMLTISALAHYVSQHIKARF